MNLDHLSNFHPPGTIVMPRITKKAEVHGFIRQRDRLSVMQKFVKRFL